MERKKISEIVELKIKNCNLSLQILQIQANQLITERNRILAEEFARLGCKPEDWRLDEQTWELIPLNL